MGGKAEQVSQLSRAAVEEESKAESDTHDCKVLLVRVGVRGVDHDAVKGDTGLGEAEGGVDVLVGRGMVEVDGDGHARAVGELEAEVEVVNTSVV